MTEYGRSGLPIEFEEEEAKIVDAYFADDNEQGNLEEYVIKHASPGLLKARSKRDKYYAKMKKKGAIIN
ncbi:hypothetical protein [Neofamilia massiliensis]|uniref:hypothetical protein n=1 Tax=Neofamilia massiliensis TaxID=1673724 RepID=UPI0006BB717F|nr:hypothetical protein [Neofamilia massiliensis]